LFENSEEGVIIKLRDLIKNWVFWLIIISAIAIIIRCLPAWLYAAWGCDFGIYLQIADNVVKDVEFFPAYAGWGSSYNEFPVLYAITAIAHWITGIDVIILMPKLIPIFGGLSVTIFYFLVNELLKNKKIALLSALFLAVLYFHPYQTSHASPLTMGHFFMMLSLYFFVKYREKNIYAVPLLFSTLLLIMSHHLTTYFYIISLIGIMFFENFYQKEWALSLKKDLIYIILTSILTFTYWAVVAKTVYNSFMQSGISFGAIRLGSNFVLIIFYIMLFTSLAIIYFIRKTNIISEKKWYTSKNCLIVFTFSLIIIFGIIITFAIIELPWTNFRLNFESTRRAISLLIIFAFAVAGFRYTRFIKNGFFIRGWSFAILLSLFYGLVTDSGIMLPDRHLEYLMYPVAILTVIGLGGVFSDPFYKGLLSKISKKKDIEVSYNSDKIKISQRARQIHVILVALLVTSSGLSIYSSFEALKQANEIITQEDIDLMQYISEKLDKNYSTVASDHRLERLSEAEGFNTTKDEVIKIWTAVNLSEYVDELEGVNKNYSRITHVIIDDIMKYDVVHMGHKKPGIYMTNETWTAAYDKFSNQPFELLYRNESKNIDPVRNESIHWAEIYRVNWTYIEENYPN